MTALRISVVAFSTVLFTCLTIATCIGYQISESRSDDNARQKEYDENPRIRVRHMDIVINDSLTAKGRYANIEVVVEAFRETFVLNVHLNGHLFASNYVQKVIRTSGVSYLPINHTDTNCYYIGRVENQQNSVAAVSTCEGINGYFTLGNFSYHIEMRKNHSDRVYRIRENSQFLYGCGTENNGFIQRFRFTSGKQRYKRSFAWPQDGDGRDKVLEVYIVNDNSQFVDKGRDANAVFQRAKDIANFASSSYQTLGIFFVLVGMEVWVDKDRIPVRSSDVDSTFNFWNTYRVQQINPFHYNDNAILITRVQFDNRVIGKSWIGTICSNLHSAAIVTDFSSSALAVGSNMAHQIGHNFGLTDDSSSCSCSDGSSNCIMNPTISVIPSTDWSSCSIKQFNLGFQQGLDICLYDAPQTIYQPTVSTCGNGIIEDGEQCDCGRSPKQECNPSCCSSTTCQLIRSASCASGRCCDISSCKILDYGRLCRFNSGGCDLPEHCDGSNSTCPADTHRPDGTQCTVNGDSAYCYDGKCRSHNSQCGLLWGQGTNSSSTTCYQRLNAAGQHYGNCGMRWLPNVTYIPCQAKDVMCGKLMCVTSTSQQLAYYPNYFLLSTASISQFTCNSVIFDYGLKVQDPGLVPNGASCGDGKMCINQTCVSVGSLLTSCPEKCQSDQVCNNIGHCQSQKNEDQSKSSSTAGNNRSFQTKEQKPTPPITALWTILRGTSVRTAMPFVSTAGANRQTKMRSTFPPSQARKTKPRI